MGSYFSWLSWSSSSSDPPKPHHHVRHQFEYQKERKKAKQRSESHSISINQNNHTGDISIGDIHFHKPIPSKSDYKRIKKGKTITTTTITLFIHENIIKITSRFYIGLFTSFTTRSAYVDVLYQNTIELVHDGLRAVTAINKNSLKVARLRFAEYYTKELMDYDDDDGDDGDDDDDEDMLDQQTMQDAAFNLHCLFESNCNWNNWDIIKMAFGIDLSDECIYIIRALNIHSNNLLLLEIY